MNKLRKDAINTTLLTVYDAISNKPGEFIWFVDLLLILKEDKVESFYYIGHKTIGFTYEF